MQKRNFLEDKKVHEAYERWINGATLFEHQIDRDYFYKFVQYSVGYVRNIPFVKRGEAWTSINMDVLREHLCNSLSELKEQNILAFEERVHEVLAKFDMLIDYEKAKEKPIFLPSDLIR